jgi:hypothetical protein
MVAHKEPLNTILKIFEILGFQPNQLTRYRKIFACANFILFGIGFWAFVAFSLVQAASLSDLLNRMLYAATVIELFFKFIITAIKFDDIKKVLKSVDDIFDSDEKRKFFERARKKTLKLALFQALSVAPSVMIPILISIYSRKLLVPLYQFESFKCTEMRFFACLTYETFGVFYLAFLVSVLDLLPICLMMMIPEYFNYLNGSIKGIKLEDLTRGKFVEIMDCHRSIRE